jgi:hypothetical protein
MLCLLLVKNALGILYDKTGRMGILYDYYVIINGYEFLNKVYEE